MERDRGLRSFAYTLSFLWTHTHTHALRRQANSPCVFKPLAICGVEGQGQQWLFSSRASLASTSRKTLKEREREREGRGEKEVEVGALI